MHGDTVDYDKVDKGVGSNHRGDLVPVQPYS